MPLATPMTTAAGDLIIRAIGDWQPDQVMVRMVPSSWTGPPDVLKTIDTAWATAMRSGARLFDGPMCRLEGFDASETRLTLRLSQTSYRIFLGTNLYNSSLADVHGSGVLANSVGVSVSLKTRDDFLLMGERNGSVVYYPNRLHPFAGALEPGDGGDPFTAARRELAEEAGLLEADLAEIRCLGIVEDRRLRQPELILRAQTHLLRADIDPRIAPDEHHKLIAIEATGAGIRTALKNSSMTPVGAGSLLLWGHSQWGDDWLREALPSSPARH